MKIVRMLAALVAGLCATTVMGAQGQGAYPDGQPVRMVVPAPPGGPGDIVARALAQQMSGSLGVPVLVDNQPGGASIPGTRMVARAAPDGHTLLLTLNVTHTQLPHMYATPPYDPFADFTPISMLYRGYSVLVAHPSLPAGNLAEAVELSRRENISFGSAGAGTTGHLFIEVLNDEYDAGFTHVPYKGSQPATQDLIGGHIQLLFDSPATAAVHIAAGRSKPLAVVSPQRLAALPDVPTAAEAGFPALEGSAWMGLFGPAGLSPQVVDKLNRAVVQAVESSVLREQFALLGVEILSTTPEAFAEQIRLDYDRWGRIIKRLGIRQD